MHRILAASLLMFFLAATSAKSCEKYVSIEATQADELLGKLKNDKASTMERIFAFQALACAELPVLRRFALQEGLQIRGNEIVKGQVLQEILMQRDGIIIDLISRSDTAKDAQFWIDSLRGSLVLAFKFKDPKAGCISLYYGDRCEPDSMMRLSGDKVALHYQGMIGEFQIQEDNTMRGFIKPGVSLPRVTAKFQLF